MSKGIECLNACISEWIRREKKYNINMSDIYFAGNGFRFHYAGLYCENILYTEQYIANKRFIKKYAKKSIWKNFGNNSYSDKIKFLNEIINKYGQIIIRVSSSRLPYNKKFLKESIISHYILINGSNDGSFSVYDGCPPIYGNEPYIGEISEESLLSNWELMCNEYIILKLNTGFNEKKFKKNVNKKRIRQLEQYLKNDKNIHKKVNNGSNCIFFLLEDLKKNLDNQNLRNIISESNLQLRVNGYMQSKYFILDSIINLNMNNNIKTLERVYKEMIHKWDEWLSNLFKAGIRRDLTLISKSIDEAYILVKEENKFLKEVFI